MMVRPSNTTCFGLEIPFLPLYTTLTANKIVRLSKILTNPAEPDLWVQRVMCHNTCRRATGCWNTLGLLNDPFGHALALKAAKGNAASP